MPVVGESRKQVSAQKLRTYEQDPMHALAEQFLDIARTSLNESGLDIFSEPSKFFMHESTKNAMREAFVDQSYDPRDPKYKNPYAIQEQEEMMSALFDNDIAAIQEAAPLGSFNPVIGMALPMHKNLTTNCVFEQVIPKDVAQSPKFTLTMETRILVDTEGNEIDIFLEQNKIHDAIKNSIPVKDVVLQLPEAESYDVIGTNFGGTGNLSIKTCITAVVVEETLDVGDSYIDSADMTRKTVAVAGDFQTVHYLKNELHFTPHYGEFDYVMFDRVNTFAETYVQATAVTALGGTATANTVIIAGAPVEIGGVITGSMRKDKFILNASDSNVKGIVLHAVIDVSSAQFDTCYTKWSARTDIYEIPEAPHLSTTVSPEEIKDINALYQVNQLTKIMSMMNIGLRNYKDDEIHEFLDNSFLGLPASQQFTGAFDFVPPNNYLQDPVTWRNAMFMDQLDSYVTSMLQVLNDQNMTISIVGRPDLIRRITPVEYTYTTPSAIGPVELEFHKTVVTSDKRVYQFISSDKMRNINTLIILLIPRNTMRVMYKLFDYQFYVSNEIRTTKNYQLPAVTAFERWKMIQYQPVQGRMTIVNPRGLREVLGTTPEGAIGANAMNDFTANQNSYASGVNGAVVTPTGSAGVTAGKW